MSYTFLKECTVVLVYDGMGYLFDALSYFNFSQTYNRISQTRRTLHSRKAKPNTRVTAKNIADFSMSVIPTDTYMESILLELIGMDRLSNNKFEYPEDTPIEPKIFDVYVLTKEGIIYKFSPAVIDSLDIGMSTDSITEFSVAFSAGDMTKIDELPRMSGFKRQGNPNRVTSASFKLGVLDVNSITNIGLAIQQSVSWRDQQSIHDANKLYTATKPILVDTTFGLNIGSYTNTRLDYVSKPEVHNIEINKDNIYISIEKSLITKRIESDDVFTESYDISLTEQSKAYVEYGGVRI